MGDDTDMMGQGEIRTFGKAQASAVIATACDFATTAIIFRLTRLVAVSTAAGAVAGGIVNCCVNYLWTFTASRRSKCGIAWRYLVVWAGSLLLNTFGTECLVGIIADTTCIMSDTTMVLVAKAAVAVTVAVGWNYTMQRWFVYR